MKVTVWFRCVCPAAFWLTMNLYTEFVSDSPRYFTDTAYLCGTEATALIRHTPFYTGQCLNLGNSIHANFFALHSTEQTLNIVCVVTVSKRGCCEAPHACPAVGSRILSFQRHLEVFLSVPLASLALWKDAIIFTVFRMWFLSPQWKQFILKSLKHRKSLCIVIVYTMQYWITTHNQCQQNHEGIVQRKNKLENILLMWDGLRSKTSTVCRGEASIWLAKCKGKLKRV